jgi:hypothetical protein
MNPLDTSYLSKKSFGSIVPFIIPLAVVLLAYTLPLSDLIMLMIFALLILVFSIYRFDPRIIIAYTILLFVIEAVLTARNEVAAVKLLAVISYWLLVVGIICILIDLCRNKRLVETVG